MHTFLNDQYLLFHAQSPHVFCRLSLWSSKSWFSVIVQSQIWTGFDQVSVRITAVISPDQHFLNHQLYLILHQSWFSLKSDHQDLYFHWMIFISHLLRSLHLSIIICVDHLQLILLRHINADIEWYLDHVMSLLLETSRWFTLQAAEFHHINISIFCKFIFLHILSHA